MARHTNMMNINRKKTFVILIIAVIGYLNFNSNQKLAAAAHNVRGSKAEALFSAIFSTIGDGFASLMETADSLPTDALSSRMTNVKGCLADPFVYAIYNHGRNNIIEGYGYKNDVYGLVLGTDNVWATNEKYFRLGIALGYMRMSAVFSSDFSKIIRIAPQFFNFSEKFKVNLSQDIYAVRLFGAYESFNDKCLKTNFGVIIGYNYNDDKPLSFGSHIVSLRTEFIKNLYAYDGYQFGLWLQQNYSLILQYTNGAGKLQDFNFGFSHNFFVTVIGLNVEKETFKHGDKKLTLSLKTGWECRVMQHSSAIFNIAITNSSDIYGFFNFRYPSRNAAIVSFRASQKLNNHWNIVGSYSTRFNKNIAIHNLSCGVEYAF
ncbi:MAG: autotransporter outer membrane beta-barrel domain-containing protein [Puniceicoccales bacterium]|jgi:hypothetical protein|nr:autotransporter outer membrane beta-barrel domain-containing protein [Puniceicoccales bacterium]